MGRLCLFAVAAGLLCNLSAEEIQVGLRFLSKQTEALRARQQADGGAMDGDVVRCAALADFCHALLNTNEFLFID